MLFAEREALCRQPVKPKGGLGVMRLAQSRAGLVVPARETGTAECSLCDAGVSRTRHFLPVLSAILDIFSWTRQKVTVFVSLQTFCPDARHLPLPARRHGVALAAMSAGMPDVLAGGDGRDGSPGRCHWNGAGACVMRERPASFQTGLARRLCRQAPAFPLESTRAMG